MPKRVLFCPFCEETFDEGETQCPAHDLPLVKFSELQRHKGTEGLADDELVAPTSLKLGRGYFFVAIACYLVGFASPFVSRSDDDRVWSTVDLAMQRAMNLWSIPLLAIVTLHVLMKRRNAELLRGARLGLFLLSLGVTTTVGYTLWRIQQATEAIGEVGYSLGMELGFGVYILIAGSVLGMIGSLRAGKIASKRASYRVR